MTKTCGDCIHFVVCEPHTTANESFPEVKGGCPVFKDKSRYIELPCAVGDTVYKTVHYKNLTSPSPIPVNIVGFHLGKFPDLRGHKRKEYLIGYDNVIHSLLHLDIEEIGKTVFLTKEEAEQALKERK